jgi:preprotein translocase SecE subunit
VAHRTIDKNKNSLAGAGSTALPEDDMASPAGDPSEDELAAPGANRDTDTEALEATADAHSAANGETDEADEDLRIVPSGAGTARQIDRPTTRGNTLLDRLLANPVTRFPTESGLELWSKVTWPEPRYAWNMTLVVIGMSVFVAVVLGAADLGLSQFVNWVIAHSGATPAASPTPLPNVPVQGHP